MFLRRSGKACGNTLEVIPPCWRIGNACCRSYLMYMREEWVRVDKRSIVYRYIDCIITVPLLLIEFSPFLKSYIANSGAKESYMAILGFR